MQLDEFGEVTSSNVEAIISLKECQEIKQILQHFVCVLGGEGEGKYNVSRYLICSIFLYSL